MKPLREYKNLKRGKKKSIFLYFTYNFYWKNIFILFKFYIFFNYLLVYFYLFYYFLSKFSL